MNIFRNFFKWLALIMMAIAITIFAGCNKLLDPGLPQNQVVTSQVYQNDSLARAAVIGLYSNMMAVFDLFNGYMSRYGGLAADELDRTGFLGQDQEFLTNSLNNNNAIVKQIWNSGYAYIYLCNDLITGLTASTSISASLRNQLLGEAYFIRALAYHYLINLFGDVPLVLTTDYTKSAVAPRTPVNDVYEQIISDLGECRNLLSDAYATTPGYSTERVRANKQAALALLARVYLYRKQWADAEATAAAVIGSGMYQLEPILSQTFLYNSKEAILQFMPVSPAHSTAEGAMFIQVIPNAKPVFILTDSLLNSFEPGDARRLWIRSVTVSGKTYYSPYKYKVNQSASATEYNMVLRLAEQYLIRAEARIMQNKLPEAIADLNVIRNRAGLPGLNTAITQTQALAAVEQERRIELFAEWGHRWFDCNRWPAHASPSSPNKSRLDEIMSALRPDTWKTTAALWPIPGIELTRNPFLIQNPGY